MRLHEIQARSFNLTRTFSGTHREVPGSFGISGNTLAPEPGSYVCPWARVAAPGRGGTGAQFDLKTWDPAYFTQLRQFIMQAQQCGIIVELVFFCTLYDEDLWSVSLR